MYPRVTVPALAALVWLAVPVSAQTAPLTAGALAQAVAPAQPPEQGGAQLPTVTVCGQQARPAAQPPAGSGPVVLFIAPCFEAQGNQSVVEAATYLYYIQTKASVPSRGVWVPYDDATE